MAPGESELTAEDDVTFYQHRPKLTYLTRILHNLIVGPGLAVRNWLESFRSLGPIREIPTRDYQPPKSPDASRWASGLGAWDRLATANDEFVSTVSDWLGDENRLNTGYRLKVKQFKELDLADPLIIKLLTGRAFDEIEADAKVELNRIPTHSRLVIVPTDESVELLPSDVGIGISQVVPVIVTALDGEGKAVAIEQPELHIHPRLQSEIAELFIEAAEKQRHQFLIETHSEHLILRILRRIREANENELPSGQLAPKHENVAVYYIQQQEGKAQVARLRIEETGEFLDPWPQGFFEERAKELF